MKSEAEAEATLEVRCRVLHAHATLLAGSTLRALIELKNVRNSFFLHAFSYHEDTVARSITTLCTPNSPSPSSSPSCRVSDSCQSSRLCSACSVALLCSVVCAFLWLCFDTAPLLLLCAHSLLGESGARDSGMVCGAVERTCHKRTRCAPPRLHPAAARARRVSAAT